MGIFDTIWRRKGRPPATDELTSKKEPVLHVTLTDRDYSGMLENGDVAIKFWLPELMGLMLDQNCKVLNTSRSDLVRQILFTYLYGKHDWLGMYERRETHYKLRPESRPLFSRSPSSETVGEPAPNIMKDLGKNTEDLKVWIPHRMKEDIQEMAGRASISLSEMIREIIVSTLIGHTYLAARKELMQMEIEVEEEVSE